MKSMAIGSIHYNTLTLDDGNTKFEIDRFNKDLQGGCNVHINLTFRDKDGKNLFELSSQ